LAIRRCSSVKESDGLEARPVDAVETTRVDRDPVRLQTRDVKGVHAAMRAESVLRHPGTEGVDGQCILATQQFEILDRYRQVKDPFLRADRTVALKQQIQVDPRPRKRTRPQ
jgi:hypothetical protein